MADPVNLPTAISDFLSATFQNQNNPTHAILSDAQYKLLLQIVSESPTLIIELDRFIDSSGAISFSLDAAQKNFLAGDFDSTTPGKPLVNISLNTLTSTTAPAGDPFTTVADGAIAGNSDSIVGAIVGALAHELGHFDDFLAVNSNGTPSIPNPYFAAEANPTLVTPVNVAMLTADEFLSEAKAVYNNYVVASEIATISYAASGSAGTSIISYNLPFDSEQKLFRSGASELEVARPLADYVATQQPSTNPADKPNQNYLNAIWNPLQANAFLNTETTSVHGLIENISNVFAVDVLTDSDGNPTQMDLFHNDGTPKGYSSVINMKSPTEVTDTQVNNNSKQITLYEVLLSLGNNQYDDQLTAFSNNLPVSTVRNLSNGQVSVKQYQGDPQLVQDVNIAIGDGSVTSVSQNSDQSVLVEVSYGTDTTVGVNVNPDGSIDIVDGPGEAGTLGQVASYTGLFDTTLGLSALNENIEVNTLVQPGFGPTYISNDDIVQGAVTNITFTGPQETVAFDQTPIFSGTIYGFVPGDFIEAENGAVGLPVSWTFGGGNILTVFESSGAIRTFQFDPHQDFTGQAFVFGGGVTGEIGLDELPVTTVPGSETVNAGQVITLSGVSVADADGISMGKTFAVTLEDTQGLLSVGTTGTDGALRADTRVWRNEIAFSGPLDQINAELAAVQYVSPNSGSDTIYVTVDDGHGGVYNTQIPVSIAAQTSDILVGTINLVGDTGAITADGSFAFNSATRTVIYSDVALNGSQSAFLNDAGDAEITPSGSGGTIIILTNGPITSRNPNLADFIISIPAALPTSYGIYQIGSPNFANGSLLVTANEPAAPVSFPSEQLVVPTISEILASPQTGILKAGAEVVLTLEMTAPVVVAGGSPSLLLNDGGTATYDPTNSTPTELVFDHIVQPTDDTDSLTVTGVDLNGATVQSQAGVNANFGGPGAPSMLASLQVDTSIPTITSIDVSPSSGQVSAGATVVFTVNLSSPVTVADGEPTLLLENGEIATYDAQNSTETALVFDYTTPVAVDVSDLSVIEVDLDGSTVEDDAGNDTDFSDISGFSALEEEGVACFCRGTLILTERGDVAVEELAIGDRVVTLSGELQPIKWIGYRAYDGRFIAGNRDVLPVRIAAGALADGVPARELWISPGHSLHLDDQLVRAEHLINGATIVQVTGVDRVEYFHIELESHDIVFADGAPSESYIECNNRAKFSNRAEYVALYPDDTRPGWSFCRPCLLWGSEDLAAIRAALLERATKLGHHLDRDPELHLVVDGLVIWPDEASRQLYRFAIAAGSTDVRLVSRRSMPAATDADTCDIRTLGVAIGRLILSDRVLRIEASHGHASLRDGFHTDEDTLRWTDGCARLPDTLLRPFANGCTLDIHLVDTELRYWLSPADAAAA